MNFEDILKLVEDTSKTKFQLAADLHALIFKATAPSALKVQPIKERAKRVSKFPKLSANGIRTDQPLDFEEEAVNPTEAKLMRDAVANGHDDHGEAH